MADNGREHEAPTRRDYLKYGGAVAVGGMFAGCAGYADPGASSTTTDTTTSTTESTTTEPGTYSVTVAPMGTVEFARPPERWVALLASYADMGFALGAGQTLGTQLPYRYATHFYEELPGVSYNDDDVTSLMQGGTIDKEIFYEMDAHVHFMEPNQLIQWYDWDQADVEEIAENVGPFFGNFIRRRSDPWHQEYRYYSLYEAFEKVAQVFQAEDRYQTFKALHDEFITGIQSRLPSKEERPQAILVFPADEDIETFYPYRLYERGVSKKQFRDLGLHDVFAGSDVGNYADDGLKIDLETMVEIDPEVLLIRGQTQKTDREFQRTIVDRLRDHPVASEVTAVQNDAIYRGGYLDQGPIINLFQTELAAQRIYSDIFAEDELFDRRRVADIINGKF